MSRKFLYWQARLVAWLGFLIIGPVRVRGKANIPFDGPFLIVANHISDLDPVLVQFACPHEIRFMAKEELFQISWLRPWIEWFRAFPVKRGTADRKAIRLALELLAQGHVVCVFPEGEISKGPGLLPLLPGFALLAQKASVPLICCGISGAQKALPYGKIVPRPGFQRIRVEWGEPRLFPKGTESEVILSWCREQLETLTA